VPVLRPLTDADVPDVLALNERNVELLAPLDAERLVRMQALAGDVRVIEHEGGFAGFVVTFAAGSSYWSDNYRWFAERYDDFAYLDRIVLHESVRRMGLGSFVYDDVEATAAAHGRLLLEVNAVPPNEASLAFHAGRGFVEVGRLGDEAKQVVMLEKVL
jgi:predicted GNAT superfamily acetyltransferase